MKKKLTCASLFRVDAQQSNLDLAIQEYPVIDEVRGAFIIKIADRDDGTRIIEEVLKPKLYSAINNHRYAKTYADALELLRQELIKLSRNLSSEQVRIRTEISRANMLLSSVDIAQKKLEQKS